MPANISGEVARPGGFTQQSSYSPSHQKGFRQEHSSPGMRVMVLTTNEPSLRADSTTDSQHMCPQCQILRRGRASLSAFRGVTFFDSLPLTPHYGRSSCSSRETGDPDPCSPTWQAQAWFSELLFLYYFRPLSPLSLDRSVSLYQGSPAQSSGPGPPLRVSIPQTRPSLGASNNAYDFLLLKRTSSFLRETTGLKTSPVRPWQDRIRR